MRIAGRKLGLLFLAGMATLGLLALIWPMTIGLSEAQQGAMQNCPRHGRMKNRYEGNRQRLSSCRTVVQDRSIGARKA